MDEASFRIQLRKTNADEQMKRLAIMTAILLLSACSPKVLQSTRTEYVYRDREVKDNIFFRDSIYIREKVKNDTVYVDKFVYKYLYRDKKQIDTLMKEVHDTTTVEKLVEKNLSVWQKVRIGSFWWLIILVIVGFRREILWIIKKFI